MTFPNTFSLSLQRQFDHECIVTDSELNRTFTELRFNSLIKKSNIVKKRGYETLTILFAFVLLPFLKRSIAGFWSCRYLHNYVKAHKDTFYQFLNNERFNWRKLVYLVALKVIAVGNDVPLREKVLIADDSVDPTFSCDSEK